MTEHRFTIKASGEVRDANGNLKSVEPVELTGLFTEEEIEQLYARIREIS